MTTSFLRSILTNKIFIAVIISVMLTIGAIIYMPRIGKTRLDIVVVPEDSAITINGSAGKSGTMYVKPGNYTVSAEKKGFAKDTQKVTVSNNKTEVELAPNPESAEAENWALNNPEYQQKREQIIGKRAQQEGDRLREANKFSELLPYIDEHYLFSIDYGRDTEHENTIFYLINNSTPKGRLDAMHWIKSKGYNPANLNIKYDHHFANPLSSGE